MKQIIPILNLLLCSYFASAQSISPQVIASAGTHYSGSNFQVSWTLGEPVITTVSNGNNIITQGFHQTQLTVTGLQQINASGIDINVFPNPTSDKVNITLANNQKDLQAELFDMNGKLLQRSMIGAGEGNTQFNMTQYTQANYLLRIYAVDGSLNNTYKIEKISQ